MQMRTTGDGKAKPIREHSLAPTPEARENELIALAQAQAEELLRKKKASSQLVCQVLKMGSEKERLEVEKLRKENAFLRAKTEALESAKRVEELYSNALAAMRSYNGMESDQSD